MTKKCIGCGVVLQSEDKEALGYTPDLHKTYCIRCFKLKHYGVEKKEIIKPEEVLKKINQKKGLVFFFIDFLNINYETINLFKKIKLPKVLVISKSDTLRKDMKYEKIKNWLKNIYEVKEDVLFISGKNIKNSSNIFKYMDEHHEKTCFITGLTNAGKSTFINSLLKKYKINKEILVSKKENTTLDFISLKIEDYHVFDTPGLTYTTYDHSLIEKEIAPKSYNITKPTTFIVNDDLKFTFKEPNAIVFYLTTGKIKRVYQESNETINEVTVGENTDYVIPGVGFINIKKQTKFLSNMKEFEIRQDLSGEEL